MHQLRIEPMLAALVPSSLSLLKLDEEDKKVQSADMKMRAERFDSQPSDLESDALPLRHTPYEVLMSQRRILPTYSDQSDCLANPICDSRKRSEKKSLQKSDQERD